MKVVFFCQSLISDWNHGNAHFLRGITGELLARGHRVIVFEPEKSWSRRNLLSEYGPAAVEGFLATYPHLRKVVRTYDEETIDLDVALDGADVVLVHEWTDPDVVSAIGRHRLQGGSYRLLFHDTHHRAATAPEQMQQYDLSGFDGALVFGEVLREIYLDRSWIQQAWTWHEAADLRVFRPIERVPEGDLVWIGNWGDDERTEELREFLLEPSAELSLRTRMHGVRYPEEARASLAAVNIEYAGWLPNYLAPHVFGAFSFTVHVPRRPYVEALPGIPTIRPFEALACGIPLVSAPWEDTEGLFTVGADYLVARDGAEMKAHLRALMEDGDLARSLVIHGRATIESRHTCAHRVDELFEVLTELAPERASLLSSHAA